MNRLTGLALELSREMHTLKAYIQWVGCRFSECRAREWIDSRRVMNVLKINRRHLQYLRDHGHLPFTRIHGNYYYKAVDLEAMLNSNYITKKRKDHGTEDTCFQLLQGANRKYSAR